MAGLIWKQTPLKMNRAKIAAQKKAYYAKHKAKIAARRKAYYAKHKAKLRRKAEPRVQ